MPSDAQNWTFYTENHGKTHNFVEIRVIPRKNQDFHIFMQNLQKLTEK